MLNIKNQQIKQVLKEYKPIWAIGYSQKLMGWDAETYMPHQGIEDRSIAEGEFAVMMQKIMLKDSFLKKIKKAEKEKLNISEEGIIRVLKRDIEIMKKLPPKFIEEFARLTSRARLDWRKAKETNNFKIFEPALTRIVEMSRRKGEYLGNEKLPYNSLLDLHEEGLTIKETDAFFEKIKEPLKKLIKKVKDSPKFSQKHEIENAKYDNRKMEELNHAILKKFNFPLQRGRLDTSAHPFTEEIGGDDVRITTWYQGKDFKRSFSAVIHEYGHALYELHVAEGIHRTPVSGGVSMGIHESQSRFWENLIGRNKVFIEKNLNLLKNKIPSLKKFSSFEVYKYMNLIVPSLIRVEADEATYNSHIMLRYEIEKGLINGKINVKDLPSVWNEKMEEYLMIKPKKDSEGVLQDIHWSMGSIGYFPTYSIGTILASQYQHKMEKDIGKIEDNISADNYSAIQEWLKEKVHKYGCVYKPKELVKKSLGENINPKYFIDHVKKKVKDLY